MKRRTLIAGIVALPVAAVARAGRAQTPPASPIAGGAVPAAAAFDGIEMAVNRTWGLDIEALLAATPDLKIEEFKGTTVLSAMVMRFDTPEHARAAYDAYQDTIGSQLLAMGQGGTPTVADEPVSELGDIASAATLHTVSGTIETYYRFVLVQEGEHFFLTSALSNTTDDAQDADSLARYLTDEGEEQGDEAIFVAEGGSTGGLWGFLPTADDAVLAGLVPIMDEILFPLPEG